jgi:hypothetical protein
MRPVLLLIYSKKMIFHFTKKKAKERLTEIIRRYIISMDIKYPSKERD